MICPIIPADNVEYVLREYDNELFRTTGHYAKCIEKECAWWLPKEKICAITGIAIQLKQKEARQ